MKNISNHKDQSQILGIQFLAEVYLTHKEFNPSSKPPETILSYCATPSQSFN